MCVYYIYSYRDLNLCNYGNWLSILREELIFSYEVGAESLRKGRIQEKMDVKLGRCQVERCRQALQMSL